MKKRWIVAMVAEEVLVNVYLHAMLEEYCISLENLSLQLF